MTGEVPVSPLSDLPLLGGLFGLLDEAAERIGCAMWFRAILGVVYAAAFGYLVAWLFFTYFVPWAGTALVRPAKKVVEGLRLILLVPDWAISRAFRRAGHIPPQFVYGYGAAIMKLADRVHEFTERGLPKLAVARSAPRWLRLALVALWFLVWGTSLPR